MSTTRLRPALSIWLELYMHFEFTAASKVCAADVGAGRLLIRSRADYIARWVQIYLRQVVAR